MTPADATIVRDEMGRIMASGVLGRSRTYTKLLEYLVACTLEGRSPKELEIAVEVFGRGSDFDPSQDSLVRVYMHNLRQKLDQYSGQHGGESGYRLVIPRGEYRLLAEPIEPTPVPVELPTKAASRRPSAWVIAVIGLLALNLFALIGLNDDATESPEQQIAASSVWSGILDDDIPLVFVVGDYYIFAELDESGNVRRLIRDFSINSAQDLDDLFMYSPELLETYYDLDLTYLPQASAQALTDLLRVVYAGGKSARVMPMSELSANELKSSHIVYVGYISALDTLMEFVFASSSLAVGDTFDELENVSTGEIYTSGAGMLRYDQRNYHDYGFLSTFPGPGGNQFLVVAGTRDEGVMHVAQALTSTGDIALLEQRLQAHGPEGPAAFEALYEVAGFDRLNLDAMLVHWAGLDYQHIWGGELP
ncbi:MAG: hypothetical protein HKN84_05180 [Gammaproteobacteria bacterium]|nr:hypothetical protein [Gammaproteobacteria bacterium]